MIGLIFCLSIPYCSSFRERSVAAFGSYWRVRWRAHEARLRARVENWRFLGAPPTNAGVQIGLSKVDPSRSRSDPPAAHSCPPPAGHYPIIHRTAGFAKAHRFFVEIAVRRRPTRTSQAAQHEKSGRGWRSAGWRWRLRINFCSFFLLQKLHYNAICWLLNKCWKIKKDIFFWILIEKF